MSKLRCLLIIILLVLTLTGAGIRAFAQPVITSFSPASGPPGTLVTISGTALIDPTVFNIGGQAAIVISNDGSTLVGMVMPGTITGKISITTNGGTITSADNFTITHSDLPVSQQGSKLVGTGYAGTTVYQGYSVALSADGNTAIAGGIEDNNGIGAAWIYTRSGNSWTQQGSKLVGTGYNGTPYQGWSVALSADGNTAIVSGIQDNNGIGAAWIYTRSGSTWTQQGNKLVGTGYSGSIIFQGESVSLSADGNTAIIGGDGDNNNIGAVWIFTRSGSSWTQQGSKLVGSDYSGEAQQGYSTFLSADGNTAIAGGTGDNDYTGAAWIYTRSGSTWTQQGNKLVGTGYTGSSIYQGWSVSLSADGNTAILGAPFDNNIGAAWIFTRSGNTWSQQGNKLIGTDYAGSPYQAISVSIAADGNTALIGGFGDDNYKGAAWIFTRNGNAWTQRGDKLVGTGYSGSYIYQGNSVSLSREGNTAIVGGYYDNNAIGAAWIFTPPLVKTLNLKVFLEGPLNVETGMMGTSLNSDNLIPLAQPFSAAPWNYAGTETVASIPNSDIVDWILIELRQADIPENATSATIIEKRAALLKSDGTIVDLDGISQVQFPEFTLSGGNNLYVVIRHRNHLAVMSASGATLNSGVYSYDFTISLSQVYGGGSGYKQVGSSFAMVSGDINQDGNIFVSDFGIWAVGFGTTNGYYNADVNMDGNTFVSDFGIWAVNFGITIDNKLKSAQINAGQQKMKYRSMVPK